MSKLKIGDMVRLVGNTSGSHNNIGDIGMVTESFGKTFRVKVNGGPDTSNFSDEEDLELASELSPIATMVKSKMDECTASGKYQLAVGWASILEVVETMEDITQNPPT